MINYRGLDIPLTQLGERVTSDNLFDPNEQVIFDFYEASRNRYRRALDIGANIGVHSLLMARQGWEVRAFEPDPQHFLQLIQNIVSHGASTRVEVRQAAVSDKDGRGLFWRVCGNTTASHLDGARKAHGPVQNFVVDTVNCREHFAWADFAKIDCEGHEAVLVAATTAETWCRMDALMEVGSAENARAIYRHLLHIVPMWSQKRGWSRVECLDDVPAHHSEGSLLVSWRGPPAILKAT